MLRSLSELQTLAVRCVQMAREAGAEHAHVDATAIDEAAVKIRAERADVVQQSSGRLLRLSVVVNRRAALVETNLVAADRVRDLVTTALELAAFSETEAVAAVPPKVELAKHPLPNLSLWDEDTPLLDIREATRRGLEAERAARARDPRVRSVEVSCGHKLEGVVIATSGGFAGAYATTYQALMVEVVSETAGRAGARSVSRQFSASRFLAELDEAEVVGAEAGRRAIAQLDAQPLDACEVPVVFHPDAGREVIAMIGRAANGSAVRRGGSYLRDRLRTRVASSLLSVLDDAIVPRAMGSRPFDAEGLRSRPIQLIDRGTLHRLLCDLGSARALQLPPTASAVRGSRGTTAAASNLVVLPGLTSPAEAIAGVASGLYVTQLMGTGFVPSTGAFSRVASGFWIERGELAQPVTRVSISTTLDAVLQGIDAVCNDLDFRTAVVCPTFRVGCMRVGAGVESSPVADAE